MSMGATIKDEAALVRPREVLAVEVLCAWPTASDISAGADSIAARSLARAGDDLIRWRPMTAGDARVMSSEKKFHFQFDNVLAAF